MTENKLQIYSQMDGVRDLPFKARGLFAMALRDEDIGDHAAATEHLNKALEAEKAIQDAAK
jgi:hypothetical protein